MAHEHDLHIMPHGQRWKIVRPNNPAPVAVCETQEEAFDLATRMLYESGEGGEVLLHGRDGTVRERNTINRRDPFPPPG